MIMKVNKIFYARFIQKRGTETPFDMGGTFFPKIIHMDGETKIFCQIEGQYPRLRRNN